jgi:hypothetical protein
MRTIRHGFIAIAVLGGPASLILTHQKLTQTWPQEASRPDNVTTVVQQAYSQCSEAPQSGKASYCDDVIRSLDQCAAREKDCDPRTAYEALLKLSVSPARQEDPLPVSPL